MIVEITLKYAGRYHHQLDGIIREGQNVILWLAPVHLLPIAPEDRLASVHCKYVMKPEEFRRAKPSSIVFFFDPDLPAYKGFRLIADATLKKPGNLPKPNKIDILKSNVFLLQQGLNVTGKAESAAVQTLSACLQNMLNVASNEADIKRMEMALKKVLGPLCKHQEENLQTQARELVARLSIEQEACFRHISIAGCCS